MVEGHVPCIEHWLTIIPQLIWRYACNFSPINTVWKSVNREVCRAVCSSLESVVGHQRISLDRPEFFQLHLSDAGLDVFLEESRGGLLLELDKLDGGHGT